jgi:hypothetical protein
MLQDLEAGKPLELGCLSGAVRPACCRWADRREACKESSLSAV